ncbi:MarR family transcriptional regulator [bacterium]|nr:MarR family transcriptional regulator [bacterium]
MTFYRDAGDLIFGTRLKRLSDRFLLDVAKTYRALGIPFETGWFPLFYLLNKKDGLSVTEIARELKITHSAVSQLVTLIEKKGYITFISDDSDRRRRLIRFTPRGRGLMQTLAPIWEAIHSAMSGVLSENEHSAGLLAALDELEDSLDQRSLHDRILTEIEAGGTQAPAGIHKGHS